MTSRTSVDLDLERRGRNPGNWYAGRNEEGYLFRHKIPDALKMMPMHCSASVGEEGDVSVFGLSGTVKGNPERSTQTGNSSAMMSIAGRIPVCSISRDATPNY